MAITAVGWIHFKQQLKPGKLADVRCFRPTAMKLHMHAEGIECIDGVWVIRGPVASSWTMSARRHQHGVMLVTARSPSRTLRRRAAGKQSIERRP